MTASIRWSGSDLREFGAALRQADRPLRRETTRALNDAARPLQDRVRERAGGELPMRGGLASRVSGMKFKVQRRGGRAGARLVIVGTLGKQAGGGQVDLKRMNAGTVRHPTFGHRPWTSQRVASGWWDKAAEDATPEIVQGVERALERAALAIAADAG